MRSVDRALEGKVDQLARRLARAATQAAAKFSALGETAMDELLGTKEVEKGVSAYADYLKEDDFKPLINSLPKDQSK